VDFHYGVPLMRVPLPPELVEGGHAIADLSRQAERLGFASAALTDHPAAPTTWRENGGHDALDPLVGLMAVAGATSRLRLLTALLVASYREFLDSYHAHVMAQM
jgi:alkanesulfonate monooxygenase SsuD/methylene tetrahydromethanopterin reductase-like flavin-dependent oxidoreductase (luciferase family)